jgi:hypothetical protein
MGAWNGQNGDWPMRIYLDDDDCPDAGDREAAARIIEEIALNRK